MILFYPQELLMRKFIFIVLVLVSVIGIVQAQSSLCGAIVEDALSFVDDYCDGLDPNSACYGASDVQSTTVEQPRPDNFFDSPGDRARLVQLTEISPQPLIIGKGEFGVALLNLQADVPDTIPGQSVLFLLTGGARLTNEVEEDNDEQEPFQAFYFLPGIGDADCYEAEPMLTIQTPEDVSVNFTFNGVETEFAPGTLLTITPTVCTVHRGKITQVVGDKVDVLEANQTVDIRIDEETGAVIPIGLRAISEREYVRGQQLQDTLNKVAIANGWDELAVEKPAEYGEEPIVADPCETQHTVRLGETLHSIAEAYDTSVLAIAEANDLANPRFIIEGQVLCIPEPGSGFEPLPLGY